MAGEEARAIMDRHHAYDVHRQPAVGTNGAHFEWTHHSPRYRQAWQTRHGSTGGRWEDFEPAIDTATRWPWSHATRTENGLRSS